MSFPQFPTTPRELNAWLFFLLIGYVAVAYAVHMGRCYWRSDYSVHAEHAKKLFDGVTFAGSSILMIGVLFDQHVLDLLGDTTLYLTIGGVAGLGYAIRSLFPPWT